MSEVQYAVGNDEAAWDQRFTRGEWDAVDGDGLTTRFAQCILERLPEEVMDAMETGSPTILDWGCARGQLVAAFRKRFPRAWVCGLDHSSAGIDQAKELVGNTRNGQFFYEPTGLIRRHWDVIINSNVMEHLLDPLMTLREHLPKTKQYYVILTPYEEPLGDARREAMTPAQRHAEGHTHVQKFHLGSFPRQVDGFARIAEIHDVEPGRIWPGYQLLVVYKRL